MNLLIIRLIIFAVLFFAGLKLYGMYRQWKLDREALEQQTTRRDGGQMVRCKWCNVHVPEDEALRDQQQWFCSGIHRDRFRQEQQDLKQTGESKDYREDDEH